MKNKYKIMFGRWGLRATLRFKYHRIGYIHIPYIFGGISIPIPIVRVDKRSKL